MIIKRRVTDSCGLCELSSPLVVKFVELAGALSDQSKSAIAAYMSLGCLTSPLSSYPMLNIETSAFRTVSQSTMSSIVRPSLLRQSCRHTTTQRTFSNQISQQSSISRLHANPIRGQSIVAQFSPFRSSIAKSIPSSTLRVAGFHASGRRPILPAGPRKHTIKPVARPLKLKGFIRGH